MPIWLLEHQLQQLAAQTQPGTTNKQQHLLAHNCGSTRCVFVCETQWWLVGPVELQATTAACTAGLLAEGARAVGQGAIALW